MITADEYFAAGRHLDSEYWRGQTPERRSAALAMAGQVILSQLPPGVDPDCDTVGRAVCEQAVFLLRNHAEQTGGKFVSAQTVGPLSQSFSLVNAAGKANIAPAAELFLDMLRRRTPRIVRTVRG